MSTLGGRTGPASPKTKALAFYLPQFHPIPENDSWWGPGFTEWLNVTRARPLYPGHYQPHVPGELGYYDLRVPEVRAAQAELARTHGVSGFVYYHYWFQGKQLLQRPFDEVLASGEPDFPFALCWANEEWTRNWDGRSGTVLMPQEYSEGDDLAHIRWLGDAFADPRYIAIDGRPLLLVYRPGLLPDPRRTTELWRAEAQRMGLPDLYLCWVDGFGRPEGGPGPVGFDATVAFIPFGGERRIIAAESTRTHRILDYPSAAASRLAEPPPPWKHFPSVMVGWDSTARHPGNATIFEGATPETYRSWLEGTVASVADVREEENYVFLLAWNEWAEGNHLEPDQRYGRAFLEATRSVLLPSPGVTSARRAPATAPTTDAHGLGVPEQAESRAHALLRAVGVDTFGTCVRLSVGADGPDRAGPGDVVRVAAPDGADDVRCDIGDGAALAAALDRHDDVGSLVLVDVLGRLRNPHLLLACLATWARAHGDVPLVLSVPNATHLDHGLGLLVGRWDPARPDHPAHDQLHLFTEAGLRRLVERCGWIVTGRDDVSAVQSDVHDTALADNLPAEMVGALTVLAETYNPQWAVEHFVWALTPTDVAGAPRTFGAALAPRPDDPPPAYTEQQRRTVERYFASIGLVATETNRRAAAGRRTTRPAWRRALGRLVHSSPRTASAYRKLRGGLG